MAPATPQDFACATAFALARALEAAELKQDTRPLAVIACRDGLNERGRPFGWGFKRLGLAHDRLMLIVAARELEVLWALEETLKSGAVCAALGAVAAPSFVATRRLDFAARAGPCAPCCCVRPAADLSAARLRWLIGAAPSGPHPLDPRAPGAARLKAELVRSRTGAAGTFMLEQDHETGRLRLAAGLADHGLAASQPARAPQPDEPAFVLTQRALGRGLVLHAVDDRARALGLRAGQAHADARAIAPGLVSAPAEPEQETRALHALALWFERFSPCVALDAAPTVAEGVMLDMSGAAHLFGGEAALLDEIARRLDRAGIPARLAMADTPGAAWGLARYGGEARMVAPPGCTSQIMADLPVEALRIGPDAMRLLARLGLQRIGDLYALPRAGLARRFAGEEGLALVRRLDQALGAEAEPLNGERAPADYRVWQAFAEPLIESEGVGFALPALAQALAAQLEQDGMGARMLALDAFRTDGRRVRMKAALSAPSRTPAHLERLLREKGLERLELGFGADALMLCALVAEPLGARQPSLPAAAAAPTEPQAEIMAGLIDRLQAKLGEGAVRRPAPFESHLPERSERWLRAGPRAPGGAGPDHGRPRPLLLFDPPEPVEAIAELPDAAPSRFVWRRAAHRVVKAEGPERLSPEWWRPATSVQGDARTRDYYAVEDEAGRRFWLFREGLYGREDLDRLPSWRLHGVFG